MCPRCGMIDTRKYRAAIGVAVTMITAALTCASCRGTSNSNYAETGVKISDTVSDMSMVKELPLPVIPASINNPELRATYMARHFWDSLDFSNHTLTCDTAFMEQNFANFISVLQLVSPDSLQSIMVRFVNTAATDKDAISMVAGVAEKYLYDYNSPLRNENLYIAFAEAFTSSRSVSDVIKARTEYLREVSMKNRPGKKANDFAYITVDGIRHRISERSECRTLLFFFDVDCDVCTSVVARMKASAQLKSLVDAGQLRVLAIYAESDGNSDNEHWHKYTADNMPQSWEVGKAMGELDDIYDLQILPIAYLISPDGIVIEKDFNPVF